MIYNVLLLDLPYHYERLPADEEYSSYAEYTPEEDPQALANTAAAANINANVNTESLGPTSAPDTGSIHPRLSSLDAPGSPDDDAGSFGSDIPYEGKSQELSQ
ncbi:hypothetical protein N7530_006610 [Penicillium desertorum]|uniref:Uncharacterized protein n=1 Tax=Penicillium desertorum TaxID=1303715 RepID=A0A9W9WS34_9EURO|nr:hypothetical protein N7530_006610 [Penicillium desertorum]